MSATVKTRPSGTWDRTWMLRLDCSPGAKRCADAGAALRVAASPMAAATLSRCNFMIPPLVREAGAGETAVGDTPGGWLGSQVSAKHEAGRWAAGMHRWSTHREQLPASC